MAKNKFKYFEKFSKFQLNQNYQDINYFDF